MVFGKETKHALSSTRLSGHVGRLALSLLVASTSLDSAAQARSTEAPIPNPDLEQACGLNVLMILDESGSIGNNAPDVRTAFKAFTAAIKNTSSSMAVAEFSKQARLPAIGGLTGEYITVTDQSKVFLDNYVDTQYNPGGNTNWEDGLRMGLAKSAFAPRPDINVPHLTVFITDGDPTRVIRGDNVTPDEYLNKVPLLDGETTNEGNKNRAADAAVPNANSLKEQGSHVLAIAVGNGVSSGTSLARIEKISGPDVYDGTGTFDITTDDIYRARNFDDLEDALREAAFQLCAPSVTIDKLIDLTPDPDSSSDAVPGPGWVINGSVSGNFEWVLPVGEDPGTNPKADITDAAGFATFQWRPKDNTAFDFTAVETLQSGFSYSASETECTFRTPDDPIDRTLTITAPLPPETNPNGFSATIPPESIVTCKFINIVDPAPAITLEKFTDGDDADRAPGPVIPNGELVNWTYVITNTGNTRLDDVTITDIVELPTAGETITVDCGSKEPQPFSLTQGESVTCNASGISGLFPSGSPFPDPPSPELPTQYRNRATVNATDSTGIPVTATDPSHYQEVRPGISVEKETNNFDADSAPGPIVQVNSRITWRYFVSNTGNEALANVTLTDDDPAVNPTFVGGDINGNNLLDINETWIYEAFGFAIAGQYANRAEASGEGGADTVFDEDPSHYFGSAPGVTIEKSTNGVDADAPPGPQIPKGDPVNWTYEVTNTGNVPLLQWSVTDDQVGAVACPRIILLPGASATCSARSTAASGQYANVGTVTGRDELGEEVTDTDPSHYFGAVPALNLEKFTNGEDADFPTGPFIAAGDPVNWAYEVTNSGNVALRLLSVVDNELGVGGVDCPPGTIILDPNDSVTCTASGVAATGEYSNLGIALARAAGPLPRKKSKDKPVSAVDPSHYFGAAPGVVLEKFTNGVDADTPTEAVRINVGDVVEWGYLVFNTGNEPLLNVQVSDDQGVLPVLTDGDTNGNGELDTDEVWLFEAKGVAVDTSANVGGVYANIGTVTAVNNIGTQVNDTDPSHYLGVFNDLVLEKTTNGVDADLPPGPNVAVGSTVTWEYEVTNRGNNTLVNPRIVDDQGVVPVFVSGDNGNGELDPGETWLYRAQGTATAGQYANVATFDAVSITGTPPNEETEEVTATDPSHYFGGDSAPGIRIEKFTNGVDADTPPGALIEVGDDAIFIYVVANTGDIELQNVAVTDDQGVAVQCLGGNPIPSVGVGQFGLCVGTTTATAGQYRNVGTASGTDLFGAQVTDSDPSHHLGFIVSGIVNPAVDIEKATNGSDADNPPGPFLQVGTDAQFTYVVTNIGNTPLANLAVTDDRGVAVDCPSGNPIPLLQPGASETCSGTTTVVEGEYANIGTVVADAPNRQTVTDNDPSHHRGSLVEENKQIPTLPLIWLLACIAAMAGLGTLAYRR